MQFSLIKKKLFKKSLLHLVFQSFTLITVIRGSLIFSREFLFFLILNILFLVILNLLQKIKINKFTHQYVKYSTRGHLWAIVHGVAEELDRA